MNIKRLAPFAFAVFSVPALATTYTGSVAMLEVWQNGNVAFTLSTSAPCNGQFILNVSTPGAKNQYAAILSAKSRGSPVNVYVTGNCIPADGFPGSSYNEPLYVYVLDN